MLAVLNKQQQTMFNAICWLANCSVASHNIDC